MKQGIFLSLLTASLLLPISFSSAQETTKSKAPRAAASQSTEKTKGERRRLPPYYGRVVDDAQREKIYAIQSSYQSEIERLEAELKAITDKRDGEIQALLTPAQLAEVQKLAQEGRSRRQRGESKSSPSSDKSAATK